MDLDEKYILETERKIVKIDPKTLSDKQRVLDIGGGGEGVISKLYQEKVVAIDRKPEELYEIGESDSLKIVMDATNLTFIDNQFDFATAFFSFMYMSEIVIGKVIKEVYRALKPTGTFEIWDIEMPSKHDVEQEIFITRLDIITNGETIRTGYGARLKEKKQTMVGLISSLTETGFRLVKSDLNENGTFHIEVSK